MTHHYHHELPFGAELGADGHTKFRIWAPSVASMRVEIEGVRFDMDAEADGWFSTIQPAPAGSRYKFVLPDGMCVPDPASRLQDGDVHDASIVTDPRAYRWRHTEWQGRPWHEAVIYEIHPGLAGGFEAIRARLPELVTLGITALELMPLSDAPGKRNWGYDGVLPYAPETSYGTPDELKALIDTAHGLGLMVILDVVYNHFGPDGAYLHVYASQFFSTKISSPWGAGIDFKRPQVAEYFTQNTLYWRHEFRFDGIRMDAVHAIAEESFLVDLARIARAHVEPGRHVHLTIEHENNRAALLQGPAPHFDAQWTDDFHHAMHVLLTGETEGYYEDFESAGKLMARVLGEGFAYQGEHSKHAGRPRGQPADGLPTTAFICFLQNHDQTGNRAQGERLTVLTSPEKLEAAFAVLLLSPFIPLLFMGDEYGATTPFLFFTDHGEELAQLVRDGRRNEFKHFAAFKDESRRDAIPDPNDVSTYEASRPDRGNSARYTFIKRLLELRRDQIVPGIPGAVSVGATAHGAHRIEAAWTLGNGRRLTMQLDLSDAPEPLPRTPDPVLFEDGSRVLIQLS